MSDTMNQIAQMIEEVKSKEAQVEQLLAEVAASKAQLAEIAAAFSFKPAARRERISPDDAANVRQAIMKQLNGKWTNGLDIMAAVTEQFPGVSRQAVRSQLIALRNAGAVKHTTRTPKGKHQQAMYRAVPATKATR